MRINKVLIASTLALPTVVVPMTTTTGCSNAWGHKVPISIGSIESTNENNPYFNFRNKNYKDIDNRTIADYLPSNYILDSQTNTYYQYATPIQTWYKTENNLSKKLPTDQWVNGSANWYTPSSSFSTSVTEVVEDAGKKYNITQACAQNVTLTANTSFVTSIAQFINKYINYAISYATSQIHDANDFAVAWGGAKPTGNDGVLNEWMYANTNSHATNETEVFLKPTSTNFNFVNFPIPSYTFETKEGKTYAIASDETKILLTGSKDTALGSEEGTIYWTEKQEVGSGDDKYTIYTYPAVPILIRAKNLTQRWTNPKKTDSIFTVDYYQNDKSKIEAAIGTSWKTGGIEHPSILKYDINTRGKDVSLATTTAGQVDKRLEALQPKGSDFIGFITYNYVQWDKPNPTLNRNNTVTLASLQTIMPAYLLQLKTDLYKKAKSDKNNSGYIVDVSKADKYSTELINLLSRNSDQGRVAKATNLNQDSKNYLQFLAFLFGTNDSFTLDFVKTTPIA